MDLFVRLATYQPSKTRSPTENFFTELVAHLLQQEPLVLNEFASTILQCAPPDDGFGEVYTQVVTRSRTAKLSGLFLDMVIGSREQPTLIIENKVDSPLAGDQLQNYLDYAAEKHSRVALLTKQRNYLADKCRDDPRFSSVLARIDPVSLTRIDPGADLNCGTQS
jgi:hypothetical protein